jgi:hypothetical protein
MTGLAGFTWHASRKQLADRKSRLASGCGTFIVFATIVAQSKLAIRR